MSIAIKDPEHAQPYRNEEPQFKVKTEIVSGPVLKKPINKSEFIADPDLNLPPETATQAGYLETVTITQTNDPYKDQDTKNDTAETISQVSNVINPQNIDNTKTLVQTEKI